MSANPCAYSTARSIAAQYRTYDNCIQCKKDHQRCNRLGDGPCERCEKLKKTCVLANPGRKARMGTLPWSSAPTDEQVQFGTILYILPTSGGQLFNVTHARTGVNGEIQVYLSRCNKDLQRVAPVDYLGSWDRILFGMHAAMSTVHVQDMEACAYEMGVCISTQDKAPQV